MARMAQKRSTPKGPSQRQLRVGELIRRTLSDLLSRQETHDADLNRLLITIGEVRVSPDLRIATVYALPLGGENKAEAIAALKRNEYELRRAVAREVLLRNVPELRFMIDESFDRIEETRRLLSTEAVQRDLRAPDDALPEEPGGA
jgi:ribosome-binding factor A